MKTYEFRNWTFAIGFTVIYLSVFIYGIIWLNNQFTIDNQFSSMRKEFIQRQSQFENTIKKEIMPSCLIKEPKWTRKH